jgi:hypothetical protein
MGRLQFTLFGNTIDIQAVPKGDEPDPESAPVDEPAEAREILPAGGPGCFDSSFDLLRGLEVREGPPGDPNLRAWLEDFMREEATATLEAATFQPLSADLAGSSGDDFSAYGIDGLELL